MRSLIKAKPDGFAVGSSAKTRGLWASVLALFLVILPLLSMTPVANADDGASAPGDGGIGGADGSGWDYRFWAQDTPNRDGNAYDRMLRWSGWTSGAKNPDSTGNNLPSVFMGSDGTCTNARKVAQENVKKPDGSNYALNDFRIVLVGTFLGDGGETGKVPYTGSPGDWVLRTEFQKVWPSLKLDLNAKTNDTAAYRERVRTLTYNAFNAKTSSICTVLAPHDPETGYVSSVTTKAQNTFTLPGGTSAVYDHITARTLPSDAPIEDLTGKITLNWGGFDGSSSNTATKSKTKDVTFKSRGSNQKMPNFTPSDLGMDVWQAGKYWWDFSAPKQQGSEAAISHKGVNDRDEYWEAKGYSVKVTTQVQVPGDDIIPWNLPGDDITGKTTPVKDKVVATNNALNNFSEDVKATAILNWDGYPSAPDKVISSASKTFTMKTNGTTMTPEFTPSDFGWDYWPAGRHWFDIKVDRQGNMASSVDTPDRDKSEMWEGEPGPPDKQLFNQDNEVIKPGEAQASGMTFTAKISTQAFGATKMVITDVVQTDKVWLGGTDKDDESKIQVIGPNGTKVAADIKITTSGGKKTVTASVGSTASGSNPLALGTYTLEVPTTPWPTAENYNIKDDSRVCHQSPGVDEECLAGPSPETEKETPDPDKVWTLDEDGSLVAQDPDWTNNQGKDQATFVPGDKVSAVVNGSVKKGFSSALDSYEIADDWTEAAEFVDFTYPGTTKVMVQWPETLKGSWVNVTDQFNFEVVNGTGGKYQTIATAKSDSDFLKRTKNLTKDVPVKFILTGKFKNDIDTDGKKEVLYNTGWEKWNNETRPTNKPPVFVETPKPNKVWSATPEGTLEYKDSDWTNNEGSDNKIFVPGDQVWAVVNGKITKDLARLTDYVIEDHYAEAVEFINFNESTAENGRVKIYYDERIKESDPVKLKNVTDMFKITNKDNRVVAEAKLDFMKLVNTQLDATGVPGFDREVRLSIEGTIYDDLMERGDDPLEIKNSGREQWNHSGTYTNTPSIFTRIPEPDKVWVLDEDGALKTEDPDWTNTQGVDGKTFVPGDSISAVVNGSIPAELAKPFDRYILTDDWSDAKKYINFTDPDKVKVFFGKDDVTNEFTIKVDAAKGVTTATAKKAFLNRTGDLSKDTPMKMIISGEFYLNINTGGEEIKMINSGSEQWNNREEPTNKPPVFVRTPDPTKGWVLDEKGALVPDDSAYVDDHTFVPGDEIGAVANGILPKNLGANLTSYVLKDDWSDGLKFVKLDKADIYIDGVKSNDLFDIKIDLKKGTTTATAKADLLKDTANKPQDRVIKLYAYGTFILNPDADCSAQGTQANDGKGCDLTNRVEETWNNKTVEGNEPGVFVRVPKPDKVWVLNKDGALVANDPNWTNNEGADNQVFLHGDKVGAVVNGKLPKNLAQDLEFYSITDDWTNSAQYVDFSNIDKEHVYVYVNGVDRTSEFDITLNGTKTTATAKASVLKGTAKQKQDRPVKLILLGEFLPWSEATDTGGETILLRNAGSETWNKQEKPTNKPPVFIWNPKPDKDVLGSKDEDGTQESINHQMVFPGQTIEYEVKLDTHLPDGMAWDVEKFGMIDKYDPLFIPNKQSLTVTGRQGIVPASKYNVTWNDSENSFELFFDKEWIQDYLNHYDYNKPGAAKPDQDGRRYLVVTFNGKVSEEAKPGQDIRNLAYQITNNSKVPTPEPEVTVPPTEPDKEDLACELNPATGLYENCNDIDGKTVVKGDYIDYRLTLDARPAASKIAYRVHKLGMIDSYDNEFLELKESNIKVTVASVGSDAKDKFTVGQDVTDMVNIQVDEKDGKAYVFFKTVDTVLNTTGETIPGNPQPADLAKYNAAPIDPLKDPGIDQDVLGNTYYIYLRTKVVKEVDDYTIYNQAEQNFENMNTVTKVVSNPLKELKPEKDVTIEVDGESVDGKEIPLYEEGTWNNKHFNYLLKSSIIPADRAYETSQWSIVDEFDTKHDRYLDQYIVRTQRDIFNEEDLVAKAGDTIAVSDTMLCGVEEEIASNSKTSKEEPQSGNEEGTEESSCYNAEDLVFQDSFEVTQDKEGVLTVEALKDSYFDTINTRLDLEQGWMVWLQFERIAPGTVKNIFTEYYNGVPREPNEVTTETPENPDISVVKYDIASGIDKGDRNEESEALTIKGGKKVEIGFLITNTGDVPLKNIKLTDKTVAGSGKITDITCEPPLEGLELYMEETVLCKGWLTGVKPGETHKDVATVTGESIFTGKEVTDDDPWNAKVPAPLAKTGAEGIIWVLVLSGILIVASLTVAYTARRVREQN